MGTKGYVVLATITGIVGGLHAEQIRIFDLGPRRVVHARVTLPIEVKKNLTNNIALAMQSTEGASILLTKLVQKYHPNKRTQIEKKGDVFNVLGLGGQIRTLATNLQEYVRTFGSKDADENMKAAVNIIQAEIDSPNRSAEETAMAIAAINTIINFALIDASQAIVLPSEPKQRREAEVKLRSLHPKLQDIYDLTNSMANYVDISWIPDQ